MHRTNDPPDPRRGAATPACDDELLRARDEAASTARRADALAVALERLSIAQQAGRVGVFEWDLVTGEVVWTPELEALVGGPMRCTGRLRAWAERVHPDDVARLEALVSEWLASTRELARWEHRVIRDDGVRWVEVSARLCRDEAGRRARMIGAVLDVTDRVVQRSELAEKEQRLRVLFENVSLGIAEIGTDERIENVNGRLCALLGYRREELVGKTITEITAPEDRERSRDLNGRLLRGELDRFDYEKRYRKANGDVVWVRVTVSPVRDPSGRVLRAVGTVEDITTRRRAEEDARRSQAWLEAERARLQTIVDTIPAGLFILEADGRASLVNDEARRIWAGAGRLASVADYYEYKAFWPDTGARLSAEEWPAAQAVQHGRTIKGLILDIERFDGTRATVVASGAPIRDESGRVVGSIATNQDISELRIAQARLEELDRRKNEFLAVLSHELRNPLAPIMNSLFVLDRAPAGGPQARRAREVIERQVGHLTRLVDDLLDVTRISRGKVRLQRERVELGALVARAAEDHRSIFAAAGLSLSLAVAPRPLPVEGDPTRLAQVIGNLLMNAAKFTPRGGRVELGATIEGGDAVVRVRDDGAGIAPDLLGRLFEPFVQADATLDRSKGGLGLGLALVRGLVELHGGRVAVASEGPGRGAEVTVRLPLVEAAPADENPPERPGGRAGVAVLVIEDNVDAAASLAEALELCGHRVATAGTGAEGIDRAREGRPDVVLCDIGLPGLDGFEVARRLRADPELGRTPLVALSGYAGPDDLERSREAGFDRHLAKPPDLGALEAVIVDVIARRRAA